MKKIIFLIFSLVLIGCLMGCDITNQMENGDTPFSMQPTHIEFYSGGLKIAEYDNAMVRAASVQNTRMLGANITWYYYEIVVNNEIVDTIIDSECLTIKYSGKRVKSMPDYY